MRVFTYSEARQHLASLLDLAQSEDVEIRRRDGSRFILSAKRVDHGSPLDVPGIRAKVSSDDICDAVREVRRRS